MQAARQPLERGRRGEVGLRDHQPIGEDDLLAGLRGGIEIGLAGDAIHNREQHVDVEFAAERAVGRKRLQDRPRIGEPAGLDHDAPEWRHRAALTVEHQAAQRELQIAPRDAADAAVAEQHGLVGARPHQRIVDADRAEFIDDDGGAAALRRTEEVAEQRGLAGAEKPGDHRDGDARAALAFVPPPERAGVARGKQVEHPQRARALPAAGEAALGHQKSISRM